MRNIIACVLLVSLILVQTTLATIRDPEPQSLDEQISAATLIVKGRFGEIINRKPFIGYNTETGQDYTLEDFSRVRNIPLSELERFAIPLVEYEILVDEVFFGNVTGPVIYRSMESFPEMGLAKKQSIERLFFLAQNPDRKTYGAQFQGSILNNVDGAYRYESYDDQSQEPVLMMPAYAAESDLEVEVFEHILRDHLNRR